MNFRRDSFLSILQYLLYVDESLLSHFKFYIFLWQGGDSSEKKYDLDTRPEKKYVALTNSVYE